MKKRKTHDQDSGAIFFLRRNDHGSHRDVIRLLFIYLPTLRETRPSMTTASSKPSIIRAVDDKPNHLARKWLDAVRVGNDASRILRVRGPDTASAFATRPTRLMLFQGLAMPFPLRV